MVTKAEERFAWTTEDIVVAKKNNEVLTAAAGETHTQGMIALVPSPTDVERLALDGYELPEELHLTLQLLGEAAAIGDVTRRILLDEVTLVASQRDVVTGEAFAAAMFNPTGDSSCWVLQVGGDDVAEQHLASIAVVDAATSDDWSVPEQHRPYCAHVTLAYTDDQSLLEVVTERIGAITFDRLRLAIGDEVTDVPFGSGATVSEQEEGDAMTTDELEADAGATHSLNETGAYTILRQRFMGIALECASIRHDNGWTDLPMAEVTKVIDDVLSGFDVNRAESDGRWHAWFASDDSGLNACVELDPDGSWSVLAGGTTRDDVVSFVNAVKKRLPSAVNTDDGRIAVQFWANGPMGPFSYGRRLAASNWDDVRVNYGTRLSKELDGLMAMGPPQDGGRLMVWHGPPGTGKTHALRALAHAWRDWCDVDYIIDADEFFEHASYMVSSLITNETSDDRWRLVVIEDAGRYLLSNAQDKIGEGLGRLLNLADGLVGQGLRQLVLMTTNEPAEELHAAVTRPGRCLANVRFGALTKTDANAWLRAHESKPTAKGPATLAELYATIGDGVIEASALAPEGGIMAVKDLIASETMMKPLVEFSTARIRALTLLDIPAFVEAQVEVTGPVDEDGFLPVAGVATMEETPTGDGRVYLANCFRWEEGGAPFRWDVEDDGAHLGSVTIGRIDSFTRDDAFIRFVGRIDTKLPWGGFAAQAVERGMVTGVSVDMDDIPEESVEMVAAAVGAPDLPLADDDVEWDPDAAHQNQVDFATDAEGGVDPGLLAAGHLFVADDADPADPASYRLPFAYVLEDVLTAVPAGIDWAAAAAGDMLAAGELTEDDHLAIMTTLEGYFERLADDDEDVDEELVDEELEASAWTEFRAMPKLPAAMFKEPDLKNTDEFVHYENGRIFGWVAQEGVCHDAFSGACVGAPLGTVDLKTYNRQPVELDDGTTVMAGVFTMHTGHSNDGADVNGGLRAQFDNTRTVSGIVTVGLKKDARGRDLGLWFSGVAAPWLSDWDLNVLTTCRPSGHWKRTRAGGWSLRAVLTVPVPGFPNRVAASAFIERSNMALAASAAVPTVKAETIGTLTIQLMLPTNDAPSSPDDVLNSLASMLLDRMEERTRIRAEVESLAASLSEERRAIVAAMTP